MRWSACFLFAALVGCGSTRLSPPAAPPLAVAPPVVLPQVPPPSGSGRVVLEADGETADVLDEDAQRLCTTPCVLDLAYGAHPLVFVSTTDRTRTSDVEIEVGTEAKVVRHHIGERHDGGALRSLGFAVLVLGAVTAASGIAAWATDATEHAPLISASGAGLAALSLPLFALDRPTDRPGSTTELTLVSKVPARGLLVW